MGPLLDGFGQFLEEESLQQPGASWKPRVANESRLEAEASVRDPSSRS